MENVRPGIKLSDIVRDIKYRKNHPRSTRIETVKEFVARGGKIKEIKKAHYIPPESSFIPDWYVIS